MNARFARFVFLLVIGSALIGYLRGKQPAQPGVASDPPARTSAEAPKDAAAAPVVVSDLRMVDEKAGWALKEQQDEARVNLLRTQDGGLTWKETMPPNVGAMPANCIFTTGAQSAWVAEDQAGGILLYRTADGGANWEVSSVPVRGEPQFSFIDAQHGWLLLHQGVAAGSEAVTLLKTEDGGATWTQVAMAQPQDGSSDSLPFGGDKTGVSFRNATDGWLTGYSPVTGSIYLFNSRDGGRTWMPQTVAVPDVFREVMLTSRPPVFVSAQDGYMAAEFAGVKLSFLLYATHDGGQTWSPLNVPVSGTDRRLVWDFVDSSHGFIANGEELYRTEDGGANWKSVSSGSTLKDITRLDFVSPQVGWAVSKKSVVKTTDGGLTWTPVAP